MASEPLFLPASAGNGDESGLDPLYLACRDHSGKQRGRALLEELWADFAPYCGDRHFLVEARRHFVSRSWEVYIGGVLLRAGFALRRPAPDEPDVIVERPGSPPIWLECTAPGPGTGDDAVRDREQRGEWNATSCPGLRWWEGAMLSEQALILRCTGALREKCHRWGDLGARRLDITSDPFVVAISLAGIDDADVTDPELPVIVKALLGVGEVAIEVHVPVNDDGGSAGLGTVADVGYTERPTVSKVQGATVSAQPFLDGSARSVSAVLFTTTGIWNIDPPFLGADLTLVHNPQAAAPLPRGTFPFGTEYWVDDDGTLGHQQHGAVRGHA